MLCPGPLGPAAGRRPIAKRPDRPCSTRERQLHPSDKTLPELQSQPTTPPTGLKLAAIDTITSLIPDTPPPPSEDRLFANVDDDFGQGEFALSGPDDQGFHDAPEEPQTVYCGLGARFVKARPCCARGQDQREGEADGLKEVPWVTRQGLATD